MLHPALFLECLALSLGLFGTEEFTVKQSELTETFVLDGFCLGDYVTGSDGDPVDKKAGADDLIVQAAYGVNDFLAAVGVMAQTFCPVGMFWNPAAIVI